MSLDWLKGIALRGYEAWGTWLSNSAPLNVPQENNEGEHDETQHSETPRDAIAASRELSRRLLRLKGAHMAEDGGSVDYAAMRGSAEFAAVVAIARTLANVDVISLSEAERRAFFINVYNALTLHGVTIAAPKIKSVLELRAFWKTTSYVVGGHVLDLDSIENGILRNNSPHPATQRRPFSDGDPRRAFSVPLDPRVHFALNCGSRSCPAIRVFSAEKLDAELQLAASSFVEGDVEIVVAAPSKSTTLARSLFGSASEQSHSPAASPSSSPSTRRKKRKVRLSPIFNWYMADFGGTHAAVVAYVSRLASDDVRAAIEGVVAEHGGDYAAAVEWAAFDWHLNSSG